MNKEILVIGGDRRQIFAAQELLELGFDVKISGFDDYDTGCVEKVTADKFSESVAAAGVLVLPYPATRDGKTVTSISNDGVMLGKLTAMLKNHHTVFAGMLSERWKNAMAEKCSKVYDYSARSDLTMMNAVPTAQGVLKTLFNNIEYTVYSSSVAVTGYGKTAKIIAKYFDALGADVTVFARSAGAVSEAECFGYNALNTCFLKEKAGDFDIFINTVPSMLIDSSVINGMKRSAVIIDIASAPFGTDFAAARAAGIMALQAGSLPGKTAPVSAGRIIARIIASLLGGETDE